MGERAGSQVIRLPRDLGEGQMGKPMANPKGPPLFLYSGYGMMVGQY